MHLNVRCTPGTNSTRADSLFLVVDHLPVQYNLKTYSERHYLPFVLEEVSGLSYKHPDRLLAVDDESGKVFEYDVNQRKIVHSISFYKSDDYEGVELVDSMIYVLKNDGDIFGFKYGPSKKTKAIKYENALRTGNDTEGLGYDAETKTLLIACKEKGSIGDTVINGRAIYRFDLTEMILRTSPFVVIGPTELKAFWEQNRDFQYDEKRIKFKPSAIATHPITGNHYILSSVGKMIVVVSRRGLIKGTYPVSPRILGQPEGITFDADGTMFISSEGEGDRGYVLAFEMKTNDS